MQQLVVSELDDVEQEDEKSSSAERNAMFDSGLFVGSVEKAFEVLRVLSAAPTPLGLSEVVKVSGMGKSAAQRFLHTLSALGYIRQDRETKAYSITARTSHSLTSGPTACGRRRRASCEQQT